MASTYSTNLALELIGNNDQAGTWGNTTNNNLGTLIEQAISGYVTQAITDGADTVITIPNGASGVARNMTLELTGALTAARNLVVPANRKLYFIFNNTTGSQSVTVKVSGQTGVSVPNGQKMVLVCNGTDVVTAVTYAASMSVGSLTLSSGAANGVTYLNASKVVTAGTALTFDGVQTLSVFGTGNSVLHLEGSATNNGVMRFRNGTTGSLSGLIGNNSKDLIFESNGAAEQMRLTSAGNFGIGTASPANYSNYRNLAINGTTGGNIDMLSNGTKVGNLFNDGTNFYAYNVIAGSMVFGTNNTERARFDSNGNLGIGTSGIAARGNLDVSSANLGGSQTRSIHLGYSAADFYGFRVTNINDAGSTYAGTFRVQRGTGAAWNDDLVVTDAGNVGIGTASPTGRFEVRTDGGTGRAGTFYSPSTTNGAQVWWVDNNTNWTLRTAPSGGITDFVFTRDGNVTEIMRLSYGGTLSLGGSASAWRSGANAIQSGSQRFLSLWQGANGAANLSFAAYESASNVFSYTTTGDSPTLYSQITGEHIWSSASSGTANATFSFTERMRLSASGNLGIGINNPAAARLIAAYSNPASVPAAGASGHGFAVGTVGYGIAAGALTSGNSYLQVTRWDGTATNYDLLLQPNGGNVGIGTTTINYRVVADCNSAGNNDNGFAVRNTNSSAYGGSYNFEHAVTGGNSPVRASYISSEGGSGNSFMRFATTISGTLAERMRLDSSGNLGIGTASPTARLQVKSSLAQAVNIEGTTARGSGNIFAAFLDPTGRKGYVGYAASSDDTFFVTNELSADILFQTNGLNRMRIDANGNVQAGNQAALATTATNGFLYVPTCAGTPTGTPTAITGMAPIVINTTNNKLYFYSGGAWRDAGP